MFVRSGTTFANIAANVAAAFCLATLMALQTEAMLLQQPSAPGSVLESAANLPNYTAPTIVSTNLNVTTTETITENNNKAITAEPNLIESNDSQNSSAISIDNFSDVLDQLIETSDSNQTSTTTVSTTTSDEVKFDNMVKCKKQSEIYSSCANSCPPSCEDSQRKPCRNYCWSGCECAPGYVKNYRWRCIQVEECPKCGENEHYRNCGTNCEPTCETYQNLPIYCTGNICKRGCFCNYGFVRDQAQNGTCVPIEKCPQKCPENEYWDIYGEPCIRTAENPRPNCLFEPPKAGCVCNTGFKRSPVTKKCKAVSSIVLEVNCSVNETFSYCGSECALSCFDEKRRDQCPTVCNRGCFCKEGYRRENTNRCVLPNDCTSGYPGYETAVFSVR